jgi:glycine cleavage system aminomethyltransferase T
MGLTALQQNGAELGAISVGDYRGATAATRFGDPQKEWALLNTGCGVYDLGFRAQISLTGNDRVRWLNGMVTNNICSILRDTFWATYMPTIAASPAFPVQSRSTRTVVS